MKNEKTREKTVHKPNQTNWALGDVVIHDADAKQPAMLMVVIGVRKHDDHVYTRYVHGHVEKQVYCNHRELLHDPARFGIEVTT